WAPRGGCFSRSPVGRRSRRSRAIALRPSDWHLVSPPPCTGAGTPRVSLRIDGHSARQDGADADYLGQRGGAVAGADRFLRAVLPCAIRAADRRKLHATGRRSDACQLRLSAERRLLLEGFAQHPADLCLGDAGLLRARL